MLQVWPPKLSSWVISAHHHQFQLDFRDQFLNLVTSTLEALNSLAYYLQLKTGPDELSGLCGPSFTNKNRLYFTRDLHEGYK
jgi:hypothetical protein